MMNLEYRSLARPTAALVGLAILAAGLTGCGEEPPPPPPPVTQNHTPPPPPVTPISQLMAEMNIDPRVELPEERAPSTDSQRRAVLTFINQFVTGDSSGLSRSLTPMDREQLDILLASGDWQNAVQSVEKVQVRTASGAGPLGQVAVLALFWTKTGFEPTMWYMTESAGQATFEAGPTPDNVLSKMSGDDMIAEWHRIVLQEQELADAPDEELQRMQIFLDAMDTELRDRPDQQQPGGPTPPSPSPNPGTPNPGTPTGPSGPSTPI